MPHSTASMYERNDANISLTKESEGKCYWRNGARRIDREGGEWSICTREGRETWLLAGAGHKIFFAVKVSPDAVTMRGRKGWKNRRLASGIVTRLLPARGGFTTEVVEAGL